MHCLMWFGNGIIMHTGALQPQSPHYNLAAHTNYVVCVNFMHGTYSLKSTPKNRFWEAIHGNFILITLRVCARNLLQGSRWRNIFRFSFWYLTWGLNSAFTSNKPTHNLLNYLKYSPTKMYCLMCLWSASSYIQYRSLQSLSGLRLSYSNHLHYVY